THENFDRMGLTGAKVKVDWTKMQGYKAETVAGNTKGIEFLFKKNKIDWLKGWASIPEAGKVKIGDEVHETKNIVIASGSVPAALKGVEVDNAGGVIVDSTGALALRKIPKSMVVIGAGIIGLELGSVYARLGAKVTFVEYLDAIAPGMDGEVQKQFQKILLKQGMDFVLGAAVKSAEIVQGKAKVVYALKKDDSEKTIEADCVLVSTGRRPHVEGLGLDTLGVEMTDRGFVKVNDRWATNIKGLYAIGDCVPGLMLAHKAEDEGIATAEVIAGKHGHVNYDVIPGVIYTTPEVASVGLTEEAAKDSGRKIKIGKFPFLGNARAKAMLQADGFVKMIADAETDRILGCHIVGPNAGEMIHEICVAMEFGASAEDVALTCHAHPTTSEAVREAALACGDGAIHA
ncbi:MAG: dihydrolipoyl dehydrogenase, partial [Paracoccus sp. (in: a-proteobacteria)]